MNTFVPIPTTEFAEIAEVLDNKRLNKQALEGWQIMLVLFELDPQGNHRTPRGWVNHPAVRMWHGSESLLLNYVVEMVVEWKRRGFKSTIADKAMDTFDHAIDRGLTIDRGYIEHYPAWIEDADLYERIASTHRLALLNKDYGWYSQFGWAEDEGTRPASYEYVWGN